MSRIRVIHSPSTSWKMVADPEFDPRLSSNLAPTRTRLRVVETAQPKRSFAAPSPARIFTRSFEPHPTPAGLQSSGMPFWSQSGSHASGRRSPSQSAPFACS